MTTKKNDKQLDREEQTRLFKEYKETKDKAIRDKLIEDNLYIAEILAKKYANKGIDYDDIFQVASIGLIYAVDRFDVDRGYQFSSFATPTIIGEIKRHFRDKGWTIRVPRRIQELSKKINNAKVDLAQELQRSPTVKDIAEYLESTEEEILEAMEASKVYSPQSLDLTYDGGEDSDISLADLIGEEDKYYEKIENNDFIEKAMSILSETEKKILIDRYFNKKTQSAIAEELNISQMTVSRLEKKILEKMKNEIERIFAN
ncbi:SigB/SigF/SigG family RNA polymerase sigma factor [Neofamilia massiliensis]|uniref:SigB/SigF/SigG family RNA polymerase sigma factor n=1 Tax=Neofamilia massiliensis TaxID=1673724 RepID=UPI0006BB5C91|nr:SigB/SigF/SigG family RNA polymerase sigma factor [Neofamilia massiliensis]